MWPRALPLFIWNPQKAKIVIFFKDFLSKFYKNSTVKLKFIYFKQAKIVINTTWKLSKPASIEG